VLDNFRTSLRLALFAAALALAANAGATAHLFVVDQVYSNADGSIQFIVFLQSPPANDEHEWKGHVLTSIHDGVSRTLLYTHDLPSNLTRNRRVLVATKGFADLGIVTPDYVMPDGFLGTGQGRIACCDGYEFGYASLPIDGVSALDGTRAVVPNLATNFAGASASVPPAPTPAPTPVVEYFNAVLDHYFVTWAAAEQANLDAGNTPTKWTRTGHTFGTYTAPHAGTSPVCRYYIPPDKGDSHFFGRGTAECNATGQKNPTFVLESSDFMNMFLPVGGVCPAATTNIYRVFSNRPDANHRYMTDKAVRDSMVAKGWIAEGDGPDLVVMCAP